MKDERGFTLVEFMIAAAIMAAVLGGTVLLATQLQQVYSTQLDDATVEEEVRFSLDWIGQAIRNAGSNPYGIQTFTAIDVSADGASVTLQADINPPDGDIADENEHLIITRNGSNEITRFDNATGLTEAMTEPVITSLVFTMFNSAGTQLTNAQDNSAATVRVRVTGQSQAYNVFLGDWGTTTLEEEFRLRTRD